MNEQIPNNVQRDNGGLHDEITLKDIILKLREWFALVRPNLFGIIAFSLTIGVCAVLYAKYIARPTYSASYDLFFEEESGGMSSAMRLASNFGLSLGGSAGTSSIAVQEHLTSRQNISKALMADVEGGRLMDRYFEYQLEEDADFAAVYKDSLGMPQRFKDSLITYATLELNEYNLSTSLDEETGILRFSVQGMDESFVYDLSNQLIANTEEAFIDSKREKGQATVAAFQSKVDSLETDIDDNLRRLGRYDDQYNALVSSVDKMKRMRLTIDLERTKVAYGEYVKGLEMSKTELMNLEPPFQYFDSPTYPLYKEEISLVKAGIFGSVITGFLLALFLIGKAEAKNIMAD